MTADIHDLLEGFQTKTTEEERRRWRPLYRLLTRKEAALRKDRTGITDKGARLDARAQYALIQELLAAAPILEPTLLRTPAPRKRRAPRAKPAPPGGSPKAPPGHGSSRAR